MYEIMGHTYKEKKSEIYLWCNFQILVYLKIFIPQLNLIKNTEYIWGRNFYYAEHWLSF